MPSHHAPASRSNGSREELLALLEPLGSCPDGPTLILLPPIRGGMVGYTVLINALRKTASLYGLRYPPDINPLKPDLIDRLARLYAKVIEAADFRSEVVLTGWSMGALLAYDAARHLADTRIRVRDVALVDPNPMDGSMDDLVPLEPGARRTFFWTSYLSFKFYEKERESLLDGGRFWTLSERERFAAVDRADPGFSGPFGEFARPTNSRTEFKFISRALVALSRYRVRDYGGDCSIICCRQFEERTKKVWTDRLIPNRRMIPVDGDHNSIMLHYSIEPIRRLLFAAPSPPTQSSISRQVVA